MESTEAGIVTDVKERHSSNAKPGIRVMPSGIVTEVMPVQIINARSPISVTLDGIVISRPSP